MANILISDSLQVSILKPEEMDDACIVSTRAFNCNGLDWYRDGLVMAGRDTQGKMVCSLEMVPHNMWWGQALIPASSIGGVATVPDEQKKGYAARLLIQAIHFMREEGFHICPLWPFSLAYYRKFGWGHPGHDVELKVWPDILRRQEIDPRRIRPARPEDAPTIAALYNAQAQKLQCRTERDDQWLTGRGMKDHFPEKTQVHLSAEGRIDGAVIYRATPQAMAQGSTLRILELIGVSPAIQLEMLRALAEIPNVQSIEMLVPRNSLLPHLFHDRVTAIIQQRLMVRVLDVAKALACLKPPRDLQGSISFEVMDWVLNEDYPVAATARMDQGEIDVTGQALPGAMRCTIGVFSQIFCGGLTTAEAREMGQLEGGSAEADALCDGLFHRLTPFRSETERG